MIFLYVAIGWLVLIVLFLLLWVRFARRRRELDASIERDHQRRHGLHVVRDGDDHQSHHPGDAA